MLNHIVGKDFLLVPQKRVVRAMNNAFSPFGWSQYRQYNKGNVFQEIINNPVTIITEPLKQLDKQVIQPIYREVVQPVGHALEKIGQGIAKDPLTFIAQAAAVAAAPFTAGQSLWALPVISAASTAAKGGSLDQILTATAISAATAAVGGGFGLENSVGGLITNGLQTGVNAAGQATFSIAGMSISASTASAIATAGQGLAMGAIAAGGAAATGKDPFQAALPSIVGSALGFAGDQLAQTQFFAPVTDALNSISQTVSPIVSKAMTGVASAMITGAITGKDMTQTALMSLANTAVSGVVSASNIVADFFRNDQGGITNMGAATQSIVADLLGSVAATIASGGKVGTQMGAQFLVNATKTLTPFLNPEFDAMATNVQLTYRDAESKVKAVNDAAIAQQNLVDKYNANSAKANALADEVNSLISKRDQIYNAYNAATTQSEVDRLKNEFNAVESQISAKTNEYNSIYNTLNGVNEAYLAAVKNTEAAQKAYFDVSKSLGDLGSQLSNKMNEMSKALTLTAAKQIDPNFNPEEYKALNNLGPAVDAATHYMSAGKDQGLFTNYADAEPQRETLIDKATATLFRASGWGSIANVPQDVYDATRNRVANFYGKDMTGLANFTVANLVQQSKMPATWFAPMWDENTKTITDAKVLFNGGENGQITIASTVLPEGMSVANFYDIQSGNADVTRGSDGKFYWTTNTGAQARIYDPKTGEVVQTTYSNYFSDKDVPAGATNITRDDQGRVVSYKDANGVLSITIRGVDNPQAEYKDYGTKFDQTDPFVQMSTYANVTDGIAANFNIKGVVQASKDIVDYMQKGATDLQKLQIATVVKSAGSVMQDVGTVLQDLSVTIGLSKTGETGTLASLGKQLENLASAKTPEQYQAAMKDIEAMRKAAQGTDIVAVNKAIAEKYPDLVGVSVFGGELFEELIQNGVGKAAMAAGGALAATLGAPALIAGAIGAGVGYGVSMAMDFSESYRGAKEEMYQRMYDIYKEKGYSDAQAAQMADGAATKAGVMNGIITMVVNGATPGDLNKVLFGGKASPAQEAITNYFVDKLQTAGKVALAEFGEGLVEGTLQGMYNESLVYSVDPSKADYAKGMADSAMLEAIIGAPVSAGAYAVDNSFDMTQRTFTLANEQFTKAINSGNIYTVGELGSVFKQWGIPATVSAEIVPEIIASKPTLLNAYSTPAELTTALKNSFGFDAAQSADIANVKFNDQITTTQEAKDKLLAAGLTGVTDKDALAAGVVGITGADQATKIATYTDQQMVSQAEALAAAKQENYTATKADLDKIVGRGVQADVIAKFISEIDPKATTTAEATQYFKDLGYTKADAAAIAQFVKSAPEAEMQAAIAAYVDPRQVTRAEAVKFFSDLGYTPTEAEINQYVVQGPDVAQANVQKQLGEYVDPRMVDKAEAKAMLVQLGVSRPTNADVEKFMGQYNESLLEGKVTPYLDTARYNSTNEQIDQLALMLGNTSVGVTKQVLDNAIAEAAKGNAYRFDLIDASIQALKEQGLTENSVQSLINASSGKLSTEFKTALSNAAAGDRAALTALQTKFETDLAQKTTALSQAIADVAAGNTSRFNAVDAAIKDLKASGLTEAQVQAIVDRSDTATSKTFQTALDAAVKGNTAQLTALQTAVQTQIGAVNAGLTEALASQSALTAQKLSTLDSKFTTAIAEAAKGNTTALENLQKEFTASQNSLKTALGAQGSEFNTRIDALGTSLSSALAAAQSGNKKDLTAATNAFTTQISQTEANLQAAMDAKSNQLGSQLTALDTKFTDAIAAASQGNLSALTAFKAEFATAQADLKAQVGAGNTTVNDRITALDTSVNSAIAAAQAGNLQALNAAKADFTSQIGATQTTLTTALQQQGQSFMQQLGAMDTRFSQAIADASKGNTTALEALKTEFAASQSDIKSQLGTQNTALSAKVDALGSSLNDAIAAAQAGNFDALNALKANFTNQVATTKTDLTTALQQQSTALNTRIDELVSQGQNYASATKQAIADLGLNIANLGTSFNTKLGTLGQTFAIQLGSVEKNILDRVTANEQAGMTRDQALQSAINTVAGDLGTTKSDLLTKVGTTEAALNTRINTLADQLNTAQQSILDKVSQYEAAGLSRDAALKEAITDVAAQLGTTQAGLLAKIGTTETALNTRVNELSGQLNNVQKSLIEKINAYEQSGLTRDTAINAAINDLSSSLGATRGELLAQIGTTETALTSKISALETAMAGRIDTVQKSILDRVSQYEAAGMTRDQALSAAISEVAGNLGTTKTDLLNQLGATQDELKAQLSAQSQATQTQITNLQKTILEQVAANEQAGMSRDQALQSAINTVATDLGTTRSAILSTIGATETNLNQRIGDLESTLKTSISNTERTLLDKIAANEAAGMSRDQALNAAVNDVASQLGTTRSDLLAQLGTTESALNTKVANLETRLQGQIQTTEKSILDRVAAYEQAGMSRDQALNAAVNDVAANLGTTRTALLSQIGTTEATLKSDIAAAETRFTQQLTDVSSRLQAQIAANEAAGMSRDQAISAAVDKVASNLGTTRNELLTQIGATETTLTQRIADLQTQTQTQLTELQKSIQTQMQAYEAAGISRDQALDLAISSVAQDLGKSKADLLTQMGMNQQQLQAQIEAASQAGQQYTQQQVQQSQTAIMEKMAQYEAAGMSRDSALNKAISDVSAQLGTTANNLLAQMGTNQQQLMAQIGQTQTQLQSDIAKAKQDIQTQMTAYEQAGIDRDTALSLAISGVSQQLGTTKSDLLSRLGTTENNLKSELAQQGAQLTGQIQGVQQLVGRPTQQATAADATTIQGMIAGTTPVNLAYDTNNDGKVDQTDLTNVQNQLAFQQNQNLQQQIDTETGLPVWIDKTTGQPVSGPSALGGQWAPTGIYAALQQQEARQAATAKAAAAQAKQAQQKNQFGQLVNMLFSAPDAAGQQVTVKTPDPSRINYIYDWSSIFATPSQASMMPSPYGAMNTVAPQQQRQASNQPLFQFASGFAEGGIVGGDMEVGGSSNVDDLLNILKGNG